MPECFPVHALPIDRAVPSSRLAAFTLPGFCVEIRDDGQVLALIMRVIRQNHRRHLAWLVTGIVVVMVAGGGAFAASQGRSFGVGLYWAITTATTVGYGDVIPHNISGQVIATLVMLTSIPMLAAVFALITGSIAAAGLRRILDMDRLFPSGPHRLVLGAHPSVPSMLHELVRAGDAVVWLADCDQGSAPPDVHCVNASPTQAESIRAAHPDRATQALVTGATDGDVLVSVVLLRAEAPQLEVTALVSSTSVREALHDLGVRQAIAIDELVAHTMAKSIETPHAGDLVAQLLDSDEHRLVELEAEPAAVGKALSTVRDEREGLVLGLIQGDALVIGIGTDPVIAVGDRLLVAESCP